jgi:hypothetical protein
MNNERVMFESVSQPRSRTRHAHPSLATPDFPSALWAFGDQSGVDEMCAPPSGYWFHEAASINLTRCIIR